MDGNRHDPDRFKPSCAAETVCQEGSRRERSQRRQAEAPAARLRAWAARTYAALGIV